MTIIISLVVALLAVFALILAKDFRGIVKVQISINKNLIECISNLILKIKMMESEIKELKKSIELTDKGVCILYSTIKKNEKTGKPCKRGNRK